MKNGQTNNAKVGKLILLPHRLKDKTVDETLAVPLYHQIFMIIKETIVIGDFAANDVIPGEIELAEIFEVSRITVKRALDALAEDGMVSRHRGRGTIVEYTKPETAITLAYRSSVRDLSVHSMALTVDAIRSKMVPASNYLAEKLGVKPGHYISRTLRRRLHEATPVDLTVNYYTKNAAAFLDVTSTKIHPISLQLVGTPYEVGEIGQHVIAVLADHFTARYLEVEVGTPLTKLSVTGFDQKNVPVHFTEIYLRPDLVRLEINLKT